MKKFYVTGMSCAACSARVEKAVNGVEGVTSCAVSLLTNSMGVEGTASPEAIISAVENAGYGAGLEESAGTSGGSTAPGANHGSAFASETPVLRRRLLWSLGFLFVLMYFSMGHTMLHFPVPPFFEGNFIALALVQLLLAAVVMVINQKFFVNGFKGLVHLSPNMDTLVALGSGVSFLWSVFVLFRMTGTPQALEPDSAASLSGLYHALYFESAAMILALITVGKLLESISKGRTTDALKSLMKLAPETATILVQDGASLIEKTVPATTVKPGDIFVVRPGQSIPVDGVVIEGSSAVNESALTGESVPQDKSAGSKVSAGTINASGFIKCRAEKTGSDTTLSKIIQMVSDAAATKAPISRIADKVSGIFVPAVISVAVLTTIIWLCVGQSPGFALARGISVLVISCPCALGLATPVAIMVGNGTGARNGILFKTAASLEATGKARTVVLDKTGTLTTGNPSVSSVSYWHGGLKNGHAGLDSGHAGSFVAVATSGVPRQSAPLASPTLTAPLPSLMQDALSLEKSSEHPLAKAMVSFAESLGYTAGKVENFTAEGGRGVHADSENRTLFGGNLKYILENCSLSQEETSLLTAEVEKLSEQGATPLIFASRTQNETKGLLLGIIAVSDTIKPDSAAAVSLFKKMGIKVVMLTGDNRKTALATAARAGIDTVISDVLPQDKEAKIKELQKDGSVIMVGDGINDAPALTQADIGMAIGSGTDVAVDAADVVLVNSSLMDAVNAVALSRKTLKNIKENLFWAFFYNVIGIPLAAGAYIHLFGWTLSPMFGAAAMSLSSFCVVTNALRLNFVKLNKNRPAGTSSSEEKLPENSEKKESNMTKTLKIEGMMCEHCEAHVKKALEALDGVTSATPSHKKGTAEVVLTKEVADSVFAKAIEDAGYKML